jgi:hypothetical protein
MTYRPNVGPYSAPTIKLERRTAKFEFKEFAYGRRAASAIGLITPRADVGDAKRLLGWSAVFGYIVLAKHQYHSHGNNTERRQ